MGKRDSLNASLLLYLRIIITIRHDSTVSVSVLVFSVQQAFQKTIVRCLVFKLFVLHIHYFYWVIGYCLIK